MFFFIVGNLRRDWFYIAISYHGMNRIYCLFSNETCSSRTVLLSHGAHSFPETLFFLKPFFYLLTKFICSLILESTFIFELVSELLAVFFWMLWMLVTVNKLKLMACHVPHASQITIQGTIFTHIFWYIPMK